MVNPEVSAPDPDAVAAATSAGGGAAFAKRRNRGNIRKRTDEGDDGEEETTVQRSTKAAKPDVMTFSTKREGPAESATGEGFKDIRFAYDSNKAIQQQQDNRATAKLETETETDRDSRALREKVLRQGQEGVEKVDDKVYKGMTGYIDYRQGFRREHTIGAEKGGGAHGPLRGSMYARVTAIMDYNPCLCKDYKETGYCSFGDSCKFMHDRGDYKSGWELEKQYEAEVKEKQAAAMRAWAAENGEPVEGGGGEVEEDDDLPFACYICRLPWADCKTPVMTRCKHYFCESCALKHNSKSGKCAVCEQPTQGIFNVAQDILKKIKVAKK